MSTKRNFSREALTARSRTVLFGAALAAVALLTGCPDQSIVCKPGTNRCGNGCNDYTTDKRNCGGCGQPCGTSEVCSNSVCTCQSGTTVCSGACVVTEYDAQNCGQCGKRCGTGEVCEVGQCKAACTLDGAVLCGNSCVNVATDVNNCGGCGVQCQSGQICRDRQCTFEVVAACLSSGELVGFRAETGERGPPADIGTQPEALAVMQGRVVSADGIDQRLYQAVIAPGDSTWRQVSRSNKTGSVPNQVFVDGTNVLVPNAASGTLQVLSQSEKTASDVVDDQKGVGGGVNLVTVAELPLGMNTYPQGVAKVGQSVWVPLYGSGGSAAAAGQKVLEISVVNAAAPEVVNVVDLSALDLKPYDGGTAIARPWAVVSHAGQVYVVLNNLDAEFKPAGPGFLARIDPTSRQVTLINLGDACLNPQSAAEVGAGLVVSCMGRPTYGPSMLATGTEHAGLVLLGANDVATARWAPAGCSSDGGACSPFLPGHLAVKGTRVFLGDQNAGRIYSFDAADGGLTEVRGPVGTGGGPIQACTVSPTTGIANVGDLLVP